MPESIAILPLNLLIDAENPRLPQPNTGQRDAMAKLEKIKVGKILVVSRDIVEAGLNPADLPIVMRLKGDGNRYVVLKAIAVSHHSRPGQPRRVGGSRRSRCAS